MPHDVFDDHLTDGKFAVYQRFNRREDLLAILAVLEGHGIPVRASNTDAGGWRENVITGSPLEPRYWVEIPADRFPEANFVLQEEATAALSDADLDAHPFAAYSEAELRSVLLEESDWSPDAVVVARALLLRSGSDVDLARLRAADRDRLRREYAPRAGNLPSLWLTIGVGTLAGLALWIFAYLVAAGVLLYYAVGYRRDPSGVQHPAYRGPARRTGVVGLLIMVVALLAGAANVLYLHWVAFPPIDLWYWIWF